MDVGQKLKLKKLRGALYGHYAQIADELGVDKSTVSRVLKGDWVNNEILEKCIDFRNRLAQKQNEILQKI